MESLYSQYTTEHLSRLLMTCLTGESAEQGPTVKALMEELEKRTSK